MYILGFREFPMSRCKIGTFRVTQVRPSGLPFPMFKYRVSCTDWETRSADSTLFSLRELAKKGIRQFQSFSSDCMCYISQLAWLYLLG